jgi:hypothetical protein
MANINTSRRHDGAVHPTGTSAGSEGRLYLTAHSSCQLVV